MLRPPFPNPRNRAQSCQDSFAQAVPHSSQCRMTVLSGLLAWWSQDLILGLRFLIIDGQTAFFEPVEFLPSTLFGLFTLACSTRRGSWPSRMSRCRNATAAMLRAAFHGGSC